MCLPRELTIGLLRDEGATGSADPAQWLDYYNNRRNHSSLGRRLSADCHQPDGRQPRLRGTPERAPSRWEPFAERPHAASKSEDL